MKKFRKSSIFFTILLIAAINVHLFAKSSGDIEAIDIGDGVNLEVVYISGGKFQMGYDKAKERGMSELILHPVELDDFRIGKYEVTQAQWKKIMGNNPSHFKGDNLPVESVTWDDCQEFIKKLNALGKGKFRLPTEAEWEYACRAGSSTDFYFGANKISFVEKWGDVLVLDEYMWWRGNSEFKSHPVGMKKPNKWNLYDMNGNVYEWCEDWFHGDYYSQSPVKNPKGPSNGTYRVVRGGSSSSGNYTGVETLCSWYRGMEEPKRTSETIGFRIAMDK